MLRLLWIFCVSLSLTTSTDMKKGQIGKEDVSKNETIRGKPNEKVRVLFFSHHLSFQTLQKYD